MNRSRLPIMLLILWLASCGGDGPSASSDAAQASTDATVLICLDTCNFANDGECDDGAAGSISASCELGTDCADCGPRDPESVSEGTCNFQNCDGCCDGNFCLQEISANACGQAGSACQSCNSDDSCVAGTCVPEADCSDCNGCCLNGTQCLEGNAQAACGTDGSACLACPDGQGCSANGQCEPIACDDSNCTNGCCTANGECVTFDQQTTDACGGSAEACNVCAAGATSCTLGTCVGTQPCLDFCDDGCCTPSGQCILFAEQEPDTCGASETCSSCSSGLSCLEGECTTDPVWQLIVASAIIAPLTPEGEEWDQALFANPLPDPFVGGNVFSDLLIDWFTPTIDNTLTPNWVSAEGVYAQSDLIGLFQLTVRDSDGLGIFETIGECSVSISESALLLGTLTKPTCGPSVNDLVLRFVRQ